MWEIRARTGRFPIKKQKTADQLKEEMVGTTGFEPATSRTPSVRATRLRHVPTACRETSLSPAFEKGQDRQQFLMKIEQRLLPRLRKSRRTRRHHHVGFLLG